MARWQIARACLAAQYPPHPAKDSRTSANPHASAIEATMTVVGANLLEPAFDTWFPLRGCEVSTTVQPAGTIRRILGSGSSVSSGHDLAGRIDGPESISYVAFV
jgi:hypothetical protein